MLNDFIIKNFIDDNNKNKKLTDLSISIDYLVFDDIFSPYKINEKKRFYYFFKNKFFSNFFFKLSKKDSLKYKSLAYFYRLNYYILLHNNY